LNSNYPHWNFFRILESDLEKCFRYIEPTKSHYSVFSDEFGKIILLACSEIENALKTLARDITPEINIGGIKDCRESIIRKYPKFGLIKISLPRYGIVVQPWESWYENDTAPDWWSNGYNVVKHDRVRVFKILCQRELISRCAHLVFPQNV